MNSEHPTRGCPEAFHLRVGSVGCVENGSIPSMSPVCSAAVAAMLRAAGVRLASFMPLAMPALSPSMTQGQLTKWLKKPGDAVLNSDTIAMVATDKAENRFDYNGDDGFLAKVFINDGDTAQVGDVIAVLVEEKEELAEADSYERPAPAATAEAPAATSDAPAEQVRVSPAETAVPPTPVAAGDVREALLRSGPASVVLGSRLSDDQLRTAPRTGKDGRFTKADLARFAPADAATSSDAGASQSGNLSPNVAPATRTSAWGVATRPVAVSNFRVRDDAVLQAMARK